MKKLDKDTVLITVDGGKFSHWAYISSEDGSVISPFELRNNMRGFDKLFTTIKRFMKEHKLRDMIVGYESTGTYLRPLIWYLKTKGAFLIQINSKHTKRVKEIVDNSPNKTDQKDPIVIAQIIRLGNGLGTLLPTGCYAELRNLIHERERCQQDRTRCLGRLEALVSEYFPEFLILMKGTTSMTSIGLLKEFTTPAEILAIGEAKLVEFIRSTSRYQLGKDRAEELRRAAEETVGVKEGLESISMRVKMQITQLELTLRQIRQVEESIITICKSVSCTGYIMSIKGVGWMTTAYILGEIGNLSNYRNVNQIIKLAGLNLYEVSSGAYRGSRRISKIGRGLLRKTLYYAAMRLVKENGVYHEFYKKRIDRGKAKKSSLVVVMKKLIRLIFALNRQKSFYCDQYNQNQIGLAAA